MQSQTAQPVLLIDDQPVIGFGFDRIIQEQGAFTLEAHLSPEQSFPKLASPVIVATDITSSKRQGMGIIRELKKHYQHPLILVMSNLDEAIYAERCLKAGARGYLMKNASADELLNALQTITNHGIYTSDNLKTQLLNRMANGGSYSSNLPNTDVLSDRELLIVQRIGQSKNNREIADEMKISIKTIESHRSRIKSKLQLGSPNELVRYAVQLQSTS